MNEYFVYITTNKARTVLYVGVTNNLQRRIYQHKNKLIPGFTSRYNVHELVCYETFPTALEAITAEKRIKGWNREKKIALIQQKNPEFRDLSNEMRD